ncbi:MAG: hypothetical protein IKK33_11335 [Lachnospiraceae bacterium]|nr:hypothetical protein [Lachnospiraceae bacterium]
MQIDCHYYGTYFMAYQAGFSAEDAAVIAWAAQTVDELDFNRLRILKDSKVNIPYFITTETTFQSVDDAISSTGFTKKVGDYITMLRGIWAPFHFLPGNFAAAMEDGNKVIEHTGRKQISFGHQTPYSDSIEVGLEVGNVLYTSSTGPEDLKMVCRPSTGTVREIVENAACQYALYYKSERIKALCAIGICMHVLADTWSHQNFAGTPSQWVNGCKLIDHDAINANYFFQTPYSARAIPNVNSPTFIGHGFAGKAPDIPGVTWIMTSELGIINRTYENRPRFLSGMLQMYDAMKYIKTKENDPLISNEPINSEPIYRFRTWEEIKSQCSFGSITADRCNVEEQVLYMALCVLDNYLLDNRHSDELVRVELWKEFLHNQKISLEKYDFNRYDIVSFVDMARVHRKVVFDYLYHHAGISISLDKVDNLIKEEAISFRYSLLQKIGEIPPMKEFF